MIFTTTRIRYSPQAFVDQTKSDAVDGFSVLNNHVEAVLKSSFGSC